MSSATGPRSAELLGLGDIARLLGRQPATAYQWKWRGLLPPPAQTVSGRPLWSRRAIEAWAAETGRPLAPVDQSTAASTVDAGRG